VIATTHVDRSLALAEGKVASFDIDRPGALSVVEKNRRKGDIRRVFEFLRVSPVINRSPASAADPVLPTEI
jgi:hypothetical protein